jgi:hypothetical protein
MGKAERDGCIWFVDDEPIADLERTSRLSTLHERWAFRNKNIAMDAGLAEPHFPGLDILPPPAGIPVQLPALSLRIIGAGCEQS